MINTLIKSIGTALNAEFGTDYEIYMEESKQDLQEPCFFIHCLNPTTKLFFGKKYFRQNLFVIQYFPKSVTDYRQECNAVAERMFWILETITVNGDKFRGTKMRYEIIDSVLNFFVNYDCFIYRGGENTAPMETLEVKYNDKEGD